MAESLGKPRKSKIQKARKVADAIISAKGAMRNERPSNRGKSTATRKR